MVEDAEVHRVWEEGVQGERPLHSLVHLPAHLRLLSKEAQDQPVPSLLERQVVHPAQQVHPALQVHLVLEVHQEQQEDHLHQELKVHLEQAPDHLANQVVQDPWHLSKDNPQEVLQDLSHLVQDQDRHYHQVR